MNARDLWDRYKSRLCLVPSVGLSLDISRMQFDDGFFTRMAPAMEKAFSGHGRPGEGSDRQP